MVVYGNPPYYGNSANASTRRLQTASNKFTNEDTRIGKLLRDYAGEMVAVGNAEVSYRFRMHGAHLRDHGRRLTGIDYTMNGEDWVGETDYQGQRLIVLVRRTRLYEPRSALFPQHRYPAFVSDRDGGALALDIDHRRHAGVELAIRASWKARASSTAPRVISTRTAPGRCSHRSPTT